VRAIAIDEHRRMRVDDLAAAIDADRAAGIVPVAVVATAGTTLTGAIDPVGAIADVCAERGVWLHVDGAYGLPAASLEQERPRFAGLERADSASVDAHKWLYLPKACGVVMVRHQLALESTFGHDEAYLPHQDRRRHAVDATLEYSRPFRALKLWLAFRAHGAAAFRHAIARNLAQARLLVEEVGRHDDLELLTISPELSIVPFRHLPAGVEPNAHNDRLCAELQRDGRVYVAPAVVDGNVYLRPCLVNYRTSDDDVRALVVVAREVGARLAAG
jgi:aromatic-L-amino-acid/L-tryptophan decarboxylase